MSTARLRSLAALLSTPSDLWLATRTVGWMASLPLLKRVLPLPRVVRLMQRSGAGRARDLDREGEITDLVRRLCRFSGGNCLERSLILYRVLGEANASPHLVVGVGFRDAFAGHVWVIVDDTPLLETSETLQGFGEIVTFGDGGVRLEPDTRVG